MEVTTSMILVFMASIIELWAGIPLGLILELNPLLIGISVAAGSISSVLLVAILGEGVRKWFLKWRYKEKSPKEGKVYDLWKKYGTAGLGLLSPLIFGAPLGTALGIGLGAPRNRLLLWMIIGIVIWSSFLTAAGFFGLINLESIIH